MFYAEQITKELIYSNLMRKTLSKPQINELLDILTNLLKGDIAYFVVVDEGEFVVFVSEIKKYKKKTRTTKNLIKQKT